MLTRTAIVEGMKKSYIFYEKLIKFWKRNIHIFLQL
jgi:hypothetical protein